MGAHPQPDRVGPARARAQPAGRRARRAVFALLQAYQQRQMAFVRYRGDGIFARMVRVGRRTDLRQVACFPGRQRAILRRQGEPVQRHAGAAGIEQFPAGDAPRAVGRGVPIGRVARAGQVTEVVLPLGQRGGRAAVDIDPLEQRRGAALAQPLVERAAEAAVIGIRDVAESQHAEVQMRQVGRRAHRLGGKARGGIGRVAFAIGAADEQDAAGA